MHASDRAICKSSMGNVLKTYETKIIKLIIYSGTNVLYNEVQLRFTMLYRNINYITIKRYRTSFLTWVDVSIFVALAKLRR